MAITYHAGRRVQGISGSTITYESDFTTNTGWVEADSTNTGVDTSTERLDFNIVRSTTNGKAYYDLGSALSDTAWVIRFKCVMTASANGAGSNTIGSFGMSSVTGDAVTTQDFLGHYKAGNNNDYSVVVDGSILGPSTGSSLGRPLAGTTRYHEMKRTSATSWTNSIYSTSDYSGTPDATHTLTIASSITGLQYFNISNYNSGSGAGVLSGYIDDVKIYDGVTSVVEGDAKPTNVQVGSRWEETDTRKMYHRISTSETNQETNSGTGELMNDVEIIAQKFTANSSKLGKKVMSVEVLLKRNTSTIASTNVECFVGVGYPIGSTAVSYGSFTASDLTTDYVWYKFTPTSGTERTLVTNDRIMIRWADGAVSDNSVRMASDQSGNNPLANETGQYSADDGSSWADRSFDYCYKIHYEAPSWKEEGT